MDAKPERTAESDGVSYLRHSRAIGVLWGVFTVCFAIVVAVVFVQPQWIGDTPDSDRAGHFGLWRACFQDDGSELACRGRPDDWSAALSPAFRLATLAIAASAAASCVCIICMLLFFVCSSSAVFHLCGWLQVLSGVGLIVGVVSFPAGWDAEAVRAVCGAEADDYDLGRCGVRWAYVLAAISALDAVVLATLAFLLATRCVAIEAAEPLVSGGSIYKGEVNSALMGETQSRKSLHPVLLVPSGGRPDHERGSDFSHRRSKISHYTASVHNFQL